MNMPSIKCSCLDCGSDKFYEGPHGGMAINIKCVNCGSEFNRTLLGLERI